MTVIHLAVHGVDSPQFPDRAALVLGNSEGSGQDGLLQAREIRDLSLLADLVILSACETGSGRLRGRGNRQSRTSIPSRRCKVGTPSP